MLVETIVSDLDEALDTLRSMLGANMPGSAKDRLVEKVLSVLTTARVKIDRLESKGATHEKP